MAERRGRWDRMGGGFVQKVQKNYKIHSINNFFFLLYIYNVRFFSFFYNPIILLYSQFWGGREGLIEKKEKKNSQVLTC